MPKNKNEKEEKKQPKFFKPKIALAGSPLNPIILVEPRDTEIKESSCRCIIC